MTAGVTAEIPAKVLLAGEYALLAPQGVGLALAVAPGFAVAAALASKWHINLPDLSIAATGETLTDLSEECEALRYVSAALRAADALFPQLGPISITLRGQPGRVPVGASASLVAGTLIAAARLSGSAEGPEALTEAAVKAHRTAQGSGSGYDVATILRGGSVRLAAGPETTLSASPAPLFPGLAVVAARVGHVAATGPLVEAVCHAVENDPRARQALALHCAASSALVEALTVGPTWSTIATACQQANTTLELLDSSVAGAIITPQVRATMEAGQPAPVRISGAGGGDLVVGFAPDALAGQVLYNRWGDAGYDSWLLEPSPSR